MNNNLEKLLLIIVVILFMIQSWRCIVLEDRITALKKNPVPKIHYIVYNPTNVVITNLEIHYYER